jgi:hypothetical protein
MTAPCRLFARVNVDKRTRRRQPHRVLGQWICGPGRRRDHRRGIFATTGSAIAGGGSHDGAGPAILVSFVLTAIACGFAALCYAEFAAMVPIAGSAYTTPTPRQQIVAWIIGWDLVISTRWATSPWRYRGRDPSARCSGCSASTCRAGSDRLSLGRPGDREARVRRGTPDSRPWPRRCTTRASPDCRHLRLPAGGGDRRGDHLDLVRGVRNRRDRTW